MSICSTPVLNDYSEKYLNQQEELKSIKILLTKISEFSFNIITGMENLLHAFEESRLNLQMNSFVHIMLMRNYPSFHDCIHH